jgi:hypothetical protein
VLDELDRELERRGLRFVRDADDCNIYVRSERAGQRVMESVTRIHYAEAQTQGECGKECGDATAGPEVSRIQFHGWPGGEARNCAESSGPVQEPGSGDHAADKERQRGVDP